MKSVRLICCAAALACGAVPSFSQEQVEVAALTEPIVQKMVPLVKLAAEQRASDGAVMADLVAQMGSMFVETGKDGKAITSGDDIREAVYAGSEQAIVPEALRFLPRVSKALYDTSGMLVAVFTFGAKGDPAIISEFEKMQTDPYDTSHARELILRGMEDTPYKRAAIEICERTDEFYLDRGWEFTGEKRDNVYSWRSPDGKIDAVAGLFNTYTRIEAKVGESSPTGPTLLLWPVRRKTAAPREDPMPAALEKAGMTGEDFTRYLNALLYARSDSRHEKDLDNPVPPGFPELAPDAPKELVAQLNEARAAYAKALGPEYAIRKANLKPYRRHSSELDASLAALSPGQ